MSGTVLNLDIDAGTDHYVNTTYVDFITNLPKNLTGYSALLEVKYEWEDPRVLLTLSSSNGRILLGGVAGTITIHFTPADTTPSSQTYKWDRAVYDLIVTDNNTIKTKLLKGFINVVGTVSL